MDTSQRWETLNLRACWNVATGEALCVNTSRETGFEKFKKHSGVSVSWGAIPESIGGEVYVC